MCSNVHVPFSHPWILLIVYSYSSLPPTKTFFFTMCPQNRPLIWQKTTSFSLMSSCLNTGAYLQHSPLLIRGCKLLPPPRNSTVSPACSLAFQAAFPVSVIPAAIGLSTCSEMQSPC